MLVNRQSCPIHLRKPGREEYEETVRLINHWRRVWRIPVTEETVKKAVEDFFTDRYRNGHQTHSKEGLSNKSKATDKLIDKISEKTYEEFLDDKE